MAEIQLQIRNQLGLHARACALFVILWLEGKSHDSVKEAGTAAAP